MVQVDNLMEVTELLLDLFFEVVEGVMHVLAVLHKNHGLLVVADLEMLELPQSVR